MHGFLEHIGGLFNNNKKMGLFSSKKEGGMMDMIRCDEQDYLIWKYRPSFNESSTGSSQYSIRIGSSLTVRNGEVAVFVVNKSGATYQEFITGPYEDKLLPVNFPAFSDFFDALGRNLNYFQADVYFINLSKVIPFSARVPYFDIFDPREGLYDFPIKCAVQYQVLSQIKDFKEFINIHSLSNLTPQELNQKMKPVVDRHIKSLLINIPKDRNIAAIQIETQLDEVNSLSENRLKPELERIFGIQINNLSIDKIDIDKDDDQYHKLRKLTAEITEKKTTTQANIDIDTVQARSDANIQNLKDLQRINTSHSEEMMRIQREEAQRAQKLQTESNYFDTHKLNVDSTRTVSSNDFSSAQNNPPVQAPSNGTFHTSMPPPPPPLTQYFVSINGQQAGPFSLNELQQQLKNGQFTRTTYVWKPGMQNWEEASMIPELQRLFTNVPPPPPPHFNG